MTWQVVARLLLGALAFCGAWLWLGDGERILGRDRPCRRGALGAGPARPAARV